MIKRNVSKAWHDDWFKAGLDKPDFIKKTRLVDIELMYRYAKGEDVDDLARDYGTTRATIETKIQRLRERSK